MRTPRFARPSYWLPAAMCLSAFVSIACNRSDSHEIDVVQSPRPVEVYTVHIDAGNNGAAAVALKSNDKSRSRTPRALIFEASGVARMPADGITPEEWAAAREAAVLDALAKAIMEARRMAGLPEDVFSEKFSDKLSVAQNISSNGEEFEVRLLDHGMERLFLLRDGTLQHPPHDFELVRKIFSETRGEFTLLPVDEAPLDRMIAKVGCYEQTLPTGRFAERTDDSAVPADVDASDAQTP